MASEANDRMDPIPTRVDPKEASKYIGHKALALMAFSPKRFQGHESDLLSKNAYRRILEKFIPFGCMNKGSSTTHQMKRQ
ncbi:hypothetical protein BVC80_1273g4 [Macleaya cordata]|uniref:Uncharacterized protein n=1 Tax=Macleaya cordata TaxID=56857 RepID=A0A200PZM2_MACCD|nr:hypothetical protein BVC80_1273g4 [Macleaya cordata]